MLRTNSKAVKEKIREYILNHYCKVAEDYKLRPTEDFDEAATHIMYYFFLEKVKLDKRKHFTTYQLFKDWLSGLAILIDTDYFVKPVAKEIVAEWLEESETEKDKYTESQAEDLITKLLFRELYPYYDPYRS